MNSTETFVPCSAKHKGCTKAHADLVWSYRAERRRQELLLEEVTGGYASDEALHFARGGARLITFKDWLIASKKPAADEVVVVEAQTVVAAALVVTEAEAVLENLSDADFWSSLSV